MIAFVWSSVYPLMAGTGGSETYTVGHVRELNKRQIEARIITLGLDEEDGRHSFPDIPFKNMTISDLEKIDDTIVFVNEIVKVKTKHPAFVIFHCSPPKRKRQKEYQEWVKDKEIIVTSNYAAKIWSDYLDLSVQDIHVVYPFAERDFARAKPSQNKKKTQILYAGRLTPEKGVYNLLAALHFLSPLKHTFVFTDAGCHTPAGKIIKTLLKVHPYIKCVPAKTTRPVMAQLMVESDVVVVPTPGESWHETFGMVSVEAQHAGCRVVATTDGGLPETDCGGVIYTKPNNPSMLSKAILKAVDMGRLTPSERNAAVRKFTVKQSVDNLLEVVASVGLEPT